MAIMSNTSSRHPLFTIQTEFLSTDERILLSYRRAKLLMQTYQLTASDIQHCSARYWAMMTDPILAVDSSMFIILSIHINLAIGTLSRHLRRRSDLEPLVNRLLRFEAVGLFLLTERGHGLDAFNIETTATKTAQGFIINTPREEACKLMPATTSSFGIAKVALVMARLIVDDEDCGPRFFVVPICDEREMFKGVESIRLGPRSGTTPLDFSITRFDHVLVPHTALVTSQLDDHSIPKSPLLAWWNEMWRVPIGAITVVAPLIPGLKFSSFIAGKYSMHRSLTGKGAEPIPIISFRTQQWPILHAVAASLVLENWYPVAAEQATDESIDPRVRHGVAVIVKTTVCRQAQRCASEIAERCGVQGTFENNFMARYENDIKGAVIAEGDVLTLCIRLFSELLLQRYQVPLPDAPDSLLARHAASLFEENKALLAQLPGGHRDPSFNALLLPQAESTIEAMGHAMAYAAGVQKGLPKPILDVYECAIIRRDPAWYSENAGLARQEQRAREDKAVASAMPYLAKYLDDLDVEAYVSAPILSDATWKTYYNDMTVIKGGATPTVDSVEVQL